MSGALFVTGADTGVGKTLVACALAYQLSRAGQRVRVLKPVISGFSENEAALSDTGLLLAAAGAPIEEASIAATSPWRFTAAIAPNMAARREGRTIDFDGLVGFCREATGGEAQTLIEGVGGVMAPIDDDHTVLDWISALGVPALLVGGSYLGAISHLLTAAAALDRRGIAVAGVVVSESETSPVPLAETAACVARFLPGIPLRTVPRLGTSPRPWEAAPDLTDLAAGADQATRA